MRTIIIKKTLYTFDELSKEAKQQAIDTRIQELNEDSHEEYFKSIINTKLDELNIEAGFTIDTSDVWYDLSYCQGSGVSFTTNTPIDMEQVLDYYSKQHVTNAKEVEGIKKDSNYQYVKENFEFTMVRIAYNYAHEYTVTCNYSDESYEATDKQEELAEKISKIVNEVKNIICRKIYDELDTEYMYMISDEAIEEFFLLNGVEFTADGIEW